MGGNQFYFNLLVTPVLLLLDHTCNIAAKYLNFTSNGRVTKRALVS